ncbi:MAG: PAS domain-containing protein [Candidatus Methylomirabilis oxyfera]|nr:PAS domain-containing protein [Candidatus Methylomirabilis oxyfera]
MTEMVDSEFERLLDYLKRERGFDFTGYKRSTLMRRVLKRMQGVQIAGYTDYMDYLEVHPDEFTHLFNTILINVTSFFRDDAAWDYLAKELLPRILADRRADGPIRVWSAGCASGEEAYTIAILLCEALGREAFARQVKIYATDVDEEALAQARHGSYSSKDLQPIPSEWRTTYFEQVGGRYTFRPELRRTLVFGRHDLLHDAPISRLDLLICRNTLMYFNAETQRQVLARFHFALNDDGVLFLGKAEMLLSHANLFYPVDLKRRVFAKVRGFNLRNRLLAQAEAGDTEAVEQMSQHLRLREVAFDMAPVPQVVIDADGCLALANERARALFSLGPQDVGRPFADLELSYRPAELRSLIEQAHAEHRTLKLTNVEHHVPDGGVQYLEVQVTPIPWDDGGNQGVCITFDDVTSRERLRADVQRAIQELETTHEELQSAHEELEATNEELQSTNEELETINEELQSTNEELETTNVELQQRSADRDHANAFLQSILASLRCGVAVVDGRMRVLIWNRRAEDLWGLRADEVQGQSLRSLDIGLPVEQIPVSAFLAGEASYEELMLASTNRRGQAIRCHITCTPYLDAEGARAGVVMMMEEVTG